MKWVAGLAIGVGAVLVIVGIKNTGGDICQVITGKPCPAFTSSPTSSTSSTSTSPTSTGTSVTTNADCVALNARLQGFLPPIDCNALFPPPLATGGKPKVSGGPTIVPDPTFHEPAPWDRLNAGMLR